MTTEAIGFSSDLPAAHAMRACVSGIDLAVWRSESGSVSAWENRCPHRGMRLSHGFVRGESLACIYHGWQFNTAGKCNYIPALPNLTPPDTVKPKTYSVVEQHKLIWVSATEEAVPCTIDEHMVPLRSLTFACGTAQAHAAFSETNLAPFLEVNQASVTVNPENNILTISSADTSEVTIVFQQLTPSSITAHIMANKHWTNTQQVALSRWCEHVRRVAEQETTDNAQQMRGE